MEQFSGNEGVYMQARRRLAGPQVIRTAASTYAIGIARGKCGRRARMEQGRRGAARTRYFRASTRVMYQGNQRYLICRQRRVHSFIEARQSAEMPLDYAKKRNVLRARARFLHHRSPVPLLIASPTLSNNAGTNVRDGSIESCVCFRDLLLPRDNVVISGAELQQKRV